MEKISDERLEELLCFRADFSWRKFTSGPDESVASWNGIPVLVHTDHRWCSQVHRCVWVDGSWQVEDMKHGPFPLRGFMNVTHWMPLPEFNAI